MCFYILRVLTQSFVLKSSELIFYHCMVALLNEVCLSLKTVNSKIFGPFYLFNDHLCIALASKTDSGTKIYVYIFE